MAESPFADAEKAAAWIRREMVMKCERQDDGQYFLKAGRGKGSFISAETVCSIANSIKFPEVWEAWNDPS